MWKFCIHSSRIWNRQPKNLAHTLIKIEINDNVSYWIKNIVYRFPKKSPSLRMHYTRRWYLLNSMTIYGKIEIKMKKNKTKQHFIKAQWNIENKPTNRMKRGERQKQNYLKPIWCYIHAYACILKWIKYIT